ncbi:MAG: 50S ribosomal protein L10 [Thermodesulfobacteriota bacterium]
MKKEEKEKIVEDLHERAAKASLGVLADFRGLTVAKMSELRKGLREAGAECQVVKNTLLTLATKDTALAVLKDHFKGPTAIVLGFKDPVAPSKVLTKFASENEKFFSIKVGALQGKLVNVAGLKQLADMPPREVLLGQLLGTMNAVPGGFVRLLAEIPRGLVNVLTAIKEEKEKQAA